MGLTGALKYLGSYFNAANINGFAGTAVWAVYGDVPEVNTMLNTASSGPDAAIATSGVGGYNFMWPYQVCTGLQL